MRPFCVSLFPIWDSFLHAWRLVTDGQIAFASAMSRTSGMITSIVFSKSLHLLGPLCLSGQIVLPIAASCALPLMLSSVPQMVTQSTQTDPPPPTTDDPLVRGIVQCCGPAVVEAYHQGRPYCTVDVHWSPLPESIQSDQQYFVGRKLQEGKHCDKCKKKESRTKQRWRTIKLKHELKQDIPWTFQVHILTT